MPRHERLVYQWRAEETQEKTRGRDALRDGSSMGVEGAIIEYARAISAHVPPSRSHALGGSERAKSVTDVQVPW